MMIAKYLYQSFRSSLSLSYRVRSFTLLLLLVSASPSNYLHVSFTILFYDVLSLLFRSLRQRFSGDERKANVVMFVEGLTYLYYNYFTWKVFTPLSPPLLSFPYRLFNFLDSIAIGLMFPMMLGLVPSLISSLASTTGKDNSKKKDVKDSKVDGDNIFSSIKRFYPPAPAKSKK